MNKEIERRNREAGRKISESVMYYYHMGFNLKQIAGFTGLLHEWFVETIIRNEILKLKTKCQ